MLAPRSWEAVLSSEGPSIKGQVDVAKKEQSAGQSRRQLANCTEQKVCFPLPAAQFGSLQRTKQGTLTSQRTRAIEPVYTAFLLCTV